MGNFSCSIHEQLYNYVCIYSSIAYTGRTSCIMLCVVYWYQGFQQVVVIVLKLKLQLSLSPIKLFI